MEEATIELYLSLGAILIPFLSALLAPFTIRFGSRVTHFLSVITGAVVLLCALLLSLDTVPLRTWRVDWIEPLGLGLGLRVDGFSRMFTMLIALVGVAVLIYSVAYIPKELKKEHQPAERLGTYYAWLLSFVGAMLGMVLARDLIQLYIFWELTGITSFMLIGFHTKKPEARYGAAKALLLTVAGGLAMLIGFILMAQIVGSFDINVLLEQRERIWASPLFGLIMVLVLLGAISKSAQFPFHVWLPNAMAAPTPISAFLHSATLVAAGAYLVGRLFPVFSAAPGWTLVASGIGMTSMLLGGMLALHQKDLKALLAYSTISQYGYIFTLYGFGTTLAAEAAVLYIFGHGLLKAGLFLVAGAVTYATGERELGAIGGLRRHMPITATVGTLAALGLAGAPLLIGFWMKEEFYAAALETGNPLFIAAVLTAGLLTFLYMLRFSLGLFFGQLPTHLAGKVHEPSMPILLALIWLGGIALAGGLFPNVLGQWLIQPASSVVLAKDVSVHFALHWPPDLVLILSLATFVIGSVVYMGYGQLAALTARSISGTNAIYHGVYHGLGVVANLVVGLQKGNLRNYIRLMLLAMIGLVIWQGIPVVGWETALGNRYQYFTYQDWQMYGNPTPFLKSGFLLLAMAAAFCTVFATRHITALLALATAGYCVGALFFLELAPDVSLVQLLVETIATVLFALVLSRIPYIRRVAVMRLSQSERGLLRLQDVLLAGAVGVGITLITLQILEQSPGAPIAQWLLDQAYPLTGARDVVAAILIDFRAMDTLGEILVFATAALGVYTLMRLLVQQESSHKDLYSGSKGQAARAPTMNALTRKIAEVVLPFSIIISMSHVLYGHRIPGDGFTAGIITSLGIAFWYIAFGYYETKRRLSWVRPQLLLVSGVVVSGAAALLPLLVGRPFFSPLSIATPAPWADSIKLNTAFLLEVGIYLVVCGGAIHIIDSMGHPEGHEDDTTLDT